MIVVKLMGGLGNQLFQYAYGRALATKFKTELILDLDFLLNRDPKNDFIFRDFDLDIFKLTNYQVFNEQLSKKFNKSSIFNKKPITFSENGFHFQPIELNKKNPKIYLEGYWQSFKYFQDVEYEIRKELVFKYPLTFEQQQLKEKIKNATSICINFRRTDFVTIPSAIKTHGVTDLNYYMDALKLLKQKLGNELELFVFSDDIEWCEKNFKSEFQTHFVKHELYKGERFASYLELMTNCKHFVIPNSTFGWWAAWLSSFEEKIIITPEQWFLDETLQSQTMDLRPKNWLTI